MPEWRSALTWPGPMRWPSRRPPTRESWPAPPPPRPSPLRPSRCHAAWRPRFSLAAPPPRR
eukprot:2976983-Prorocentrum_lima.AAC.1